MTTPDSASNGSTSEFNNIQKLAIEHYEGGDLAYVGNGNDLKICGDGLLEFPVTELSDTESCEDMTEAVRRLRSAANQLETLAEKLETLEVSKAAKNSGPK